MYNNVFSEFEITDQYIKVSGATSYTSMKCVGTCETELEVKTVTKKCRGTVVETVTSGTGNGTMTESLHLPYEVYISIFGMERDDLATGVVAYGENSTHPEFALTQKVLDETGDILLKAYPRCVLQTGPKVSIENGAEEVAEVELEIALLPDDNGECMYQAYLADVTDTAITEDAWLTGFTTDMVAA